MVSRLKNENKTTLSILKKLLKRLCALLPGGIGCTSIAIVCSFYAAAQPSKLINRNIDFTKLPDELGLSQSSINSILQDRNGYLWIATWSGLVRYDGYTTYIFHSGNAPGDIKSNLISTLFEDHAGNIWVGTHIGGLFLYDKRTNQFSNYKHDDADPHTISSNNIWKINEDSNGNLWIATEWGLNFFNRETQVFQSFFYDQSDPFSLSGNFVTDVFIGRDGNLWVATNRGVNKLVTSAEGKFSFEHFFYGSEDAGDNFTFAVGEVIENDNSVIVFITNKGLNRINNGKLQNLSAQNVSPGCSLLRCMLKINDEKPFLLLGSAKGLNLFDFTTNSFTPSIGNFDNLSVTVSKESIHITALYMDRGGVLWVGTKKGLYKSDSYQKNFKLYLTSTFDKTNSIISGIEKADGGGYWLSTLGGGLFTMKDEKFEHYRFFGVSARGYFVDFIQTLFKDSRGTVWIGTAGAGVLSFRPEDIKNSTITKFNHYYTQSTPSISGDYIVSFAEDKKGAVWIGTWGGGFIKMLPDGRIIQYTDPLFTKAPLVVMHPDSAGDLWVGTRGNGIYRLHEKKNKLAAEHYFYTPDSNGLCNDFINDIVEDHSGRLWIGTEGGLMYFERSVDKFVYHDIKDGPSIKVIVSILEDNRGMLWLSHWSGITVIDPIKKNFSYGKNFNKHDHIQGDFYFNNVCLKDDNGNLLFGGSNGLNIIDPEDILQNPLSPNILITQFKLSNKPINQNETVNNRVLLKKPIDEADSIILNHNENAISFEFSALDFAAPEKIQYAYKLEGFDADWIHTEASRRYATYTNLNPGNYIFQVKAMNNDGLWSNNIRSLHILIKLPWWKTDWAIVLYALISVGVLLVLYKLLLIRTAYIHDIKIERLQRENAENLNKAKLQFFTNISHEFRTPLTLILAPVQSLIDSNNNGNLERKYLLRIHSNAQRLLRLVNQLLDFRKTETGNLKLEVAESNLVKFIKEIKLSFDSLAEKMKINFTFHSSASIIKAWFDPDQFEKILFNLLSNAFKNSKEGSKISLQVLDHNTYITIVIEDNGKGIKQENLEKIFQSFFSYNESRHQESDGTGIGLALVKSLVDAHHGTIQVESKEHEFTRFIVTISAGHSHFSESEMAKANHDIEDVTVYPSLSPEILFDEDPRQEILNQDSLPKILVVEDNREVREYIRTIFVNKYQVLEADQGKAGFQLAQDETPDIIISDVMMPIMDGITLCKTLKSHIATSHIPVILLTARTSLIFKVEGLETGADEYMSKPFSPKILQLKVRNLLRSREAFRNIFQDQKALQIEPRRVTLNSTDEKFVQEVLDSIEKNMNNTDYSVEILNQEVGMSRTLLYKKLKALTGQSPIEFIRNIRLKRAAQLLEQNELTIAEITYLVGFQDLQYFRECFKKLFGVTPSEYSQSQTSNKIKNHDDA